MKLNPISEFLSTVEVEKNETALTPTGIFIDFGGKPHSKGGTPAIPTNGTMIFSKKDKLSKEAVLPLIGKDKPMSPADMTKQFDTTPHLKTLTNKDSDKLATDTAELMLGKNVAMLKSIFDAQESKKTPKKVNEDSEEVFQDGGIFNGYLDLPVQLFQNTAMVKENLFNKKLFNDPRVGEYQTQSIAYDPVTKTYKKDPLSLATRRESVKHLFDAKSLPNWKHIDVYDDKGNPVIKDGKRMVNSVPEGDFTFNERTNALGQTLPSFIDNDNDRYQVPMFQILQVPKWNNVPTPNSSQPLQPLPLRPLVSIQSNIPSKLPSINVPQSPNINGEPTNSGEDLVTLSQQLSMANDLGDLASLRLIPPQYQYEPQNVAYQRFLPINTLVNERQFNLQKESLEASNLPESVKQAYLNDMYAKLSEGVSEVNLRNAQGDLQTDNQNINLYNNVTNQNRAERLNENRRYEELSGRALSNYEQEKNRIKQQLLSRFAGYAQDKQSVDLVNQLGNNYKFINGQIQYVPNQGTPTNWNVLSQYDRNFLEEQLKKASTPEERTKILELMYKK